MAPQRRAPLAHSDESQPHANDPQGKAMRWRRPTWRDPRLAAGLALVGAAVALGAWGMDKAANTEELYALTRDVAPGEDLTADGVLTVVSSRPGTGEYIKAGDLPTDAIATRSLSAGELLPAGAVGEESAQDLRSVVLEISSGLPATAGAGDKVDLWALPSAEAGADKSQAAQQVAEGLIISAVGTTSSSLVGSGTTSVEVLVHAGSLSEVLTAVGSGGPLVLVPTGEGV